MEYWIIGSKSGIFPNKYHKNPCGDDKINNIPQTHHSITPPFHYSGCNFLRHSQIPLA